jgi:hypothetical protein
VLNCEKLYLLVVALAQTWTERLVSTCDSSNGDRRENTGGRLRPSGEECLVQSTEVRDQAHHAVVKDTKSARSRHTPKLYADVEWGGHITGSSQKRPGKRVHRAASSAVAAKLNLKRKTAMFTELEENPYQRARLSYRRQEHHLDSSDATESTPKLPVLPVSSVQPAVDQHTATDGEMLDQPGPHVEFEPAVTHTGSIVDRVLDGEPAATIALVAYQEPASSFSPPVVDTVEGKLQRRARAELRAQGTVLRSSADVIPLPSAEMVMLLVADSAVLSYVTNTQAETAPPVSTGEGVADAATRRSSREESVVGVSDAGHAVGKETGK